MIRKTVYPIAAGVVFGLWVLYTAMLVFTGQMMSVDEEWQGWGDVLLNPFFMGVWVVLGAAFVALALLHLPWRRR